jgi:hypothetical protein
LYFSPCEIILFILNILKPSDATEKVDEYVIYIIVAIVLLFVASITTVIIVSLWQTRYPPVPVNNDNEGGFSEVTSKEWGFSHHAIKIYLGSILPD